MIMPTSMDDLGMDALQNILARLSSVDLASADCVSRSWNHVCAHVLCRPNLSSACSFSRSLQVAVENVVNKVLQEPIRPHFAIVSVFEFDLEEAHQLINAKLGSKFPVITNRIDIRRDSTFSEFKEDFDRLHVWDTAKGGIMLIVGFLPGLKLQPISLRKQNLTSGDLMVDKFMTDIRDFSTFVSGRHSPAAIMIFSGPQACMDVVMEKIKMDSSMSSETVVVGYQSCEFQYTNGSSRNTNAVEEHAPVAVALVFVPDTNNPLGIGKTKFHVVLSNGLLPTGPVYAAFVKTRYDDRAAVSARIEGSYENLDDGIFLNQAFQELWQLEYADTLYIGVTKRRKCYFGWITSLSFHEVTMFNREYLLVNDVDMSIKNGDTFRFFFLDSAVAANVSNDIRSFKQWSSTRDSKWEAFGGLIFVSSCHSGSYLDQPNIVKSMLLDNFPCVTLGKAFYGRVFGNGDLTSNVKQSQEQKSVCCYAHEYCVAYLIMSYTP